MWLNSSVYLNDQFASSRNVRLFHSHALTVTAGLETGRTGARGTASDSKEPGQDVDEEANSRNALTCDS